MENLLVSVIIPAYNRAHLIGETLDSVLAQTYPHWECIVVDDHSSDNTGEIVEAYCQRDARIKLFRRPEDRPKGANACRNLGVERSSGDFLIFLDSDDLLSKHSLRNRLSEFKEHEEYDFLVFTMATLSNTSEFKSRTINNDIGVFHESDYLKKFLSYQLPWAISCPIWRKGFFISIGKFDESLQRLQDVDLHIRALVAEGVKFKRIMNTPADCFYRLNLNDGRYKNDAFIHSAANSFLYLFQKIFILSQRNREIFPKDYLKHLRGMFKAALFFMLKKPKKYKVDLVRLSYEVSKSKIISHYELILINLVVIGKSSIISNICGDTLNRIYNHVNRRLNFKVIEYNEH